MSSTEVNLSGMERASLLLFALGQKRASEILKYLEPREVELIGANMVSLRDISPDMVNVVLDEFVVTVKKQTALGVDSEEYIRNVLTNALGSEKAEVIIDRILIGGRSKGINQLKWMDTRSIADLVRSEHPQIVANILSLLEGQRAADVLMCLSEEVRSNLLMRIASLEGVPLAALRELDEIMEEQLAGNESIKSSFVGGINVAANILNHMDTSVCNQLLEEISGSSADLAQKIQDKMFVFEDLVNLDDRGMQTLLREVATDRLLLALRGVSDVLKNKIFSNMSKRAADMLREDLEAAPPAKLSEVELAQKEILTVVRNLADSGAIVFGGGDDQLV
ncbi:flagellar motor switch protein FliG [Methylosarcina fibrata]|uniref:flagellar motor switch protein FliG n=1 Tax=Methylosarcina fibrata TaxID=105972 RepID=UPI0003817666|nr:flagellar motor switch protein FliG [Methylosarcina fibrata]